MLKNIMTVVHKKKLFISFLLADSLFGGFLGHYLLVFNEYSHSLKLYYRLKKSSFTLPC